MRFAIVAVAAAGVVLANEPVSTVYTTKYYTLTDCPETVTDCPAHSTVVTSSVIPLTTSTVYTTKVYTVTSCPPTVPDCPAHSTVVVTETEAIGVTVCPVETTSTKPYSNSTIATPTKSWIPPKETLSSAAPTKPACPATSVKTIHTSYTTVIPTVIYETVEIPCPTSKPSHSANGTTPAVPTKTPVQAGASAISGSILVAALAGAAALIFA